MMRCEAGRWLLPMLPSPSPQPPGWREWSRMLVALFLVVYVVLIIKAPPLQSANDRSRWCTIWSLLNRGSYIIDEILQRPGWQSIDVVRLEGHFYSTKPPLMATWIAGVTWLVSALTGWTLEHNLQQIHATVLLLVNGVPFVWMLWWLRRILEHELERYDAHLPMIWAAWFTLLVACSGTLISPFLCTLNNHTIAAWGVMGGIYCWWRLQYLASPQRVLLRNAFWWGFWSGWAIVHDLPAAVVAAWFLLHVWRSSRRTLWTFCLGLALPLLGLIFVNRIATNKWVPVYALYGTTAYRYVHEGVPSYWLEPQGVDRNLDTPAVYLLHCLVGHHGWFSLTPIWLVCLMPLASGWWRALRRATLLCSVIVLCFYLTRTQNYNYGGVSCALRWAIFLIPLWCLTLFGVLREIVLTFWGRLIVLSLLLLSVYSAWEPLGRPWQQPWLFRRMTSWGWIQYDSPPPPLSRPLFGWWGHLPPAGQVAWTEWSCLEPWGNNRTLRAELQDDITLRGRRCAHVKVTLRQAGYVIWSRDLFIDRAAYERGAQPAQVLVWNESNTDPEQQQRDLAIFRGLPKMQAFQPGPIRYLKTGMRGDAFRCQRAASQVGFMPNDSAALLRYRCDVWLSDEIPFGTAQIIWTIADAESDEILMQERWQVTACEPAPAPTSPLAHPNP